MTMLVCYPSKKDLKNCIGEPLVYRETSAFGNEYKPDGKFAVAFRPSIWNHPTRGAREFFAEVTMVGGKIAKVE